MRLIFKMAYNSIDGGEGGGSGVGGGPWVCRFYLNGNGGSFLGEVKIMCFPIYFVW